MPTTGLLVAPSARINAWAGPVCAAVRRMSGDIGRSVAYFRASGHRRMVARIADV